MENCTILPIIWNCQHTCNRIFYKNAIEYFLNSKQEQFVKNVKKVFYFLLNAVSVTAASAGVAASAVVVSIAVTAASVLLP